jgi:iron complex transport system substrate-binding protein
MARCQVPHCPELRLRGTAGDRSRQLAWDEVKGLNPDVLIVMPCGFDLEAARAEADKHADRLRWVAPRAVESGNAFVVDGSAYFSRSGPRFVTGIEILAAALHPDRCGHYAVDGRATRWPGSAS